MSEKKFNITYHGKNCDDFELLQLSILHELKSASSIIIGYTDLIRADLDNGLASPSENFIELVLHLGYTIDRTALICDEIKALTENTQVHED